MAHSSGSCCIRDTAFRIETIFPLSHNSAGGCPCESWLPASATLRPPAVDIEPHTQKHLVSPAWTVSSKICFPNRQLPPVRPLQSDGHLQLPLLFKKRGKTFKTVGRASSGSRSHVLNQMPRRQQTSTPGEAGICTNGLRCGERVGSGGKAPSTAATCKSNQS